MRGKAARTWCDASGFCFRLQSRVVSNIVTVNIECGKRGATRLAGAPSSGAAACSAAAAAAVRLQRDQRRGMQGHATGERYRGWTPSRFSPPLPPTHKPHTLQRACVYGGCVPISLCLSRSQPGRGSAGTVGISLVSTLQTVLAEV